ncbi:uncharacterized protein LOC133331335, partial [Musca vetustissima]|uniref:uncharacterized protein LOC133331335 n=1 Tax=Musca vetustissima TaxID=27455 RepID=UPI002AB6E65E
MEIDAETLITEVFTRPVLWDKSNKSYHNRIIVENNWKHIEGVMQKPKQLKKKWKGLRDQFRNEYKKIPVARSGDPGISEEEFNKYIIWPHFKSLLFLKNQIKPRKSSGNLRPSEESEQASTEDFLADDIEKENSFVELCDESSEKSNAVEVNKKRKATYVDGTSEILAIEKQKLQLLEKKVNTQKERDDDVAFFDSLLPYMRDMDSGRKMLCRIDIQKIVYNYAFPSLPHPYS